MHFRIGPFPNGVSDLEGNASTQIKKNNTPVRIPTHKSLFGSVFETESTRQSELLKTCGIPFEVPEATDILGFFFYDVE